MATATSASPAAEHQYAQLKAFLMQADQEGRSIYDHLQACMLDILDENTLDVANRPERFAEFSALIKRQQFGYGEAAPATASAPVHDPTVTQHATQARSLFSRPAPDVSTTVEQPTPYTTITTTTVSPKTAPPVPAIATEAKMWRYAGVGLPAREAFHLEQSITKLAMQYELSEVRFFGKIFGTHGNYLVVTSKRHVEKDEKIFEEVNTEPKPPRKKVEVDVQAEPGYKGCNRLTFWVAPDAVSPWVKLPDVTPQQINTARNIKKAFTGDLDHVIRAYPHFEGSERIYLRAQLSRILSATYISPVNALEAVAPEEEEEEEEEEGKPAKAKPAKYFPLTAVNKEYAPDEEAGVAALVDLEQWTHAEAYIYETGRQTKVPPKPEVEGEEEEEPQEEEEEAEEVKEEEEKELFGPLKKDGLFAVISVPKEPNPDEEEEEEPEPEAAEDGEEGKDPNDPDKMEEDEEIPDDEPLKRKIYPWVARATNMLFKKHGLCIVRSLRWPGAVAYAAQQGKKWGAVYFGDGLKKTDHAFTPLPATAVQKESPDMIEVADATAANEKLVLRGEEPKEADSEDEKEDEEEEEPQDE